MDIKSNIKAAAITAVICFGAAAVQATAAPSFQEQEHHDQSTTPDYSKNKTYQQGMREGKDDQSHNRDHSKKHHFKKTEDQQAYEAGYQQGHR